MMPYIHHVALLLAGCLSFYKVLLQKETFFRLNRWVLIACLALAFTLPVVQVPQQWSFRKPEAAVSVPSVSLFTTENGTPIAQPPLLPVSPLQAEVKTQSISFSQVMTWLVWLYWMGVIIFGINFLLQLGTLYYRAYTLPVIKDGRYRIVELTGDQAPCSFGNNIFINPEKYDWDTYNQILLHEKIHIRQGHSFDILLAELGLVFQWFNPFAWIYRKELETNLEFLTDDQLLRRQEVDKTSYQMSLLKVSAPHFPLSLTTNYNQSLLKKRVLMMNAKKSNLHTTWKYFFLAPLLIILVCLLNRPMASPVTIKGHINTEIAQQIGQIQTEGYWFATIKGDKVSMQFKSEEDEASMNSATFSLAELKELPRDHSGSFTISRDAGSMQLTGKFEGEQGMGRYQFKGNREYGAYLQKEGIEDMQDKDLMVFFLVNVNRQYINDLKAEGYTQIKKSDLIPLAALRVDRSYIQSIKNSGFTSVPLRDLIPLKALGVSEAYIKEIRNAGNPRLTTQQLITYKSQGIDAAYLTEMKKAGQSVAGKEDRDVAGTTLNGSEAATDKDHATEQPGPDDDDDDNSAGSLLAMKALQVDAAYIQSMKSAGFEKLSNSELMALKATGVTAAYVKELRQSGYHFTASELPGIKSQNVTPAYLQSFRSVGWNHLELSDGVAMRAVGLTPEYIRGFQSIGYPDIAASAAVGMKAQGITPELVQQYKKLGLQEVSLGSVMGAHATGTTPAYIESMKEKGQRFNKLDKYITLKSLGE
jgi:hypothetical protein